MLEMLQEAMTEIGQVKEHLLKSGQQQQSAPVTAAAAVAATAPHKKKRKAHSMTHGQGLTQRHGHHKAQPGSEPAMSSDHQGAMRSLKAHGVQICKYKC